MDFAAEIPLWGTIAVAFGLVLGAAIVGGRYIAKALTGDKGASIADLLSTINDQMTGVRGEITGVRGEVAGVRQEVQDTRSELLGEIRGLEGRIRGVETEQARTQGMLSANKQPDGHH